MLKCSWVNVHSYAERMRRMLKHINKIFSKSSGLMTEEYKKEFEKTKTEANMERCKIMCKMLLGIDIALLVVDILLKSIFANKGKAVVNLYYGHIISLIFICLWLIVMKVDKKNNNNKRNNLMCYAIINIVIYWAIFMALNSLNLSGQISAYFMGILGVSICVYLTPLESYIILFTSFIIFVCGLGLMVSDTTMLVSHIINSFIVIIVSRIASRVSYYNFIKNFINKKAILESKSELEATNLRLREYEKLRTDFFANISHELRTPVNVIYSAEQMIDVNLKNKDFEQEKIDKYLKMIKQNSYRLIRLINNLIDISKIDATVFEIKPINCDIVSTVENITMSVSEYIESRNISLTFDTEVEEKVIACDPDKIERIVLNLLSNAIKFTPKNGEVFVKLYLSENKLCISVKDTGIGIAEDMRELIFDRFIQVDKSISRSREGSGIGLSLVKSLVELHGGSVQVNSVLGQGSEFIFSLPDVLIEDTVKDNYFSNLSDQRVDRINIEFSDIYD